MNGLTDIEWKMFNQAKFLEALGLEFDQKYGTFDFISQYGFDTLANYADYFMDPQKLNLKDNIKLSDVIDLFYFDMEVRKQVISAMELFEKVFKQAMQYVISKRATDQCTSYTADEYLNKSYTYENKVDGVHDVIRRGSLKNRFRKVRSDLRKKDPNKDNVTPKEMVNNLYFNNVSDWYFLLNESLRKEINNYIVNGFKYEKINNDGDYEYVENIIRLCNGFRNQAAHGGIVFNYYDSSLRVNYQGMYLAGRRIMQDEKQYHCGIGILLISIAAIENYDVKEQLFNGIHSALKNYFGKHPEMKKEILHSMGIDTLMNLKVETPFSIFDDLS